MRSDNEYRELFTTFVPLADENYSQINEWFEKNKADIPSPLYWAMSYVAYKHKEPNSEIFKWLSLAQITGRFDLSRCKDSTSSGAYIELVQSERDVIFLMKKDSKEYFDAVDHSIEILKENPYHASPMWVCSHGISAFKFKDNQPLPVSYDDLVKPEAQSKEALLTFLEDVKKTINKHRNEKP